jgi:hypothetical protein
MDVRWASGFRLRASGSRLGADFSFRVESRVPNVGSIYIFVIVKVPEPLQVEVPVNVQLPLIVFPLTLPERVRMLPEGVPDVTDMPNLPVTLPLKFPANVNDPVSV